MSERVKHTPGPWQAIAERGPLVRDGNVWWRIYTVVGVDSTFIAECGRTADAAPSERAADAANARLIAAGPTMYEFIARKAQEGDADAAAIIAAVNN